MGIDRSEGRADLGALLDRIIRLRGALEHLTADNAALRRELARLRRENRLLKGRHAAEAGTEHAIVTSHSAPK